MTLDNDNTIHRLRVQKLLLAIISGAIIITLLTTNPADIEFLGISKKMLATIIGIIYGIYFSYQVFLEPYYILFTDNNDAINIKYYPSTSFSSKKHNIVIPKSQFHKFELSKKLINKKQKLVLYQKTDRGIFKYPPICLSALNKKEFNNIKQLLTSNLQKPEGK